MRARKVENFKWQMMELPDGITTSNGSWYHITAEKIEEYAPGILKEYSLEKMIKDADAWVKSADSLSLMFFFLLTFLLVEPWISFTLSILFYFIWYFNTSMFVSLFLSPIVKFFGKDGILYSISALLLISISMADSFSTFVTISVKFEAVWYGIILFFLFKVGLMRLFIKFIQSKNRNQRVEMQDRILNMLIIRYGLKVGILTGEVDAMQNRLIEVANYHKTRKKK